jgi:hypothetical protein
MATGEFDSLAAKSLYSTGGDEGHVFLETKSIKYCDLKTSRIAGLVK